MRGVQPDGAAELAATIAGFEITEVVHASAPRVIYRGTRLADGEPVILKTLLAQYPRKRDVAEIRREYQIADKLRLDGVIRVHSLVTFGAGNVAIEMEPFGLSLADHLAERSGGPLAIERFFDVAVRLAQILGRLHEHDVVHKDVVPRNVLIEPSTGELRLIDFGIASELSRERPTVTLSERLEGSLPYISPEQTGRMNRDVDYRSDYYSLGCTFFELLTGRLPFSAETALEWVHQHISQPAPPARALRAEVSEMLSRIVAKLMSKSVEDRYQSTFGLISDLERCRVSPTPFVLGELDVSRRFQIPQNLYGRERELEQLRVMFDDVAHGLPRLCLVSGDAGVGKSALVNELSKSIVGKNGYLIQGKFDQFLQSSAYRAFALAFRGLLQQLLGESEARLERWRDALRTALGQSGRLIVDLVPELELIIGAQPTVPELPPTEAQNRFQLVFVSFLKVFASEEHPLVVFMDDLHWSDIPTLNLIQRLATARELGHLFLIGAYRSGEVLAGHPLRLAMSEIGKTREIADLALEPLDPDAVARLTADTLHSGLERVQPLSALIHEKTRGNAFFVSQLLGSLDDQGAIVFDPDKGRWEWDIEVARRADSGDNVVDFMVTSLRRMSDDTQRVLELAACIGNTFDLETLSVISQRSMEETGAALGEALQRNVVSPLTDNYTLVGFNATYKFQHDRVQQAAYALIDDDRRQSVHLSVGRLIQAHSTGDELGRRLIEVVGHLNAGRALIADADERRELARMNLRAGLEAQRSSAYESALGFLRIGRELLPGEAWTSDYDLTLALSTAYQQCAYLTGDYDEANAWTETMLGRARTPLEKAEILSARTRQYATIGKMRESIRAAIAGLSLLGVGFTETPGAETVAAEAAAVERNLAGRTIAELIDAPPLTEPSERVAMRLLMEIFPAAFLSGSGDLFPYLVLKSVNISLRYGTGPESAFSYAAYGMLLCGALNEPAVGYEYGKLAVAMNDKLDDIALKSRVIYVYAMFIHHWSAHWSSMTPWFRKGIEAGYQSGDLLYLAYSAQDCIIWDPKLDLETASEEQRGYLRIVADCEYKDSLDSGTLFLQMQLNFRGLTDGLYSMSDGTFDEAATLAGMRERAFMTGVANYQIYKAEIHGLYGDYAGALAYVEAEDAMIASSMSLPQLVRFVVVAFLTRAALDPIGSRGRLEADLRQMSSWAAHCPENFEHLRALMRAELARVDGHHEEALRLYEQAIAAANANDYRRDEAMANELAGKCLLGLGLPRAAEGYLRAARYLYYRWGATRKVEDMQRRYPQLLDAIESAPRASAKPGGHTTTTTESLQSAMDMSSVMKASQAISGEIVLEQLVKTTIDILLENAGAQKGYFVAREGDGLSVLGVTGEAPPLPLSVIHSVLRTGKALVLDDATRGSRFANDPYIVEHQPKSVLCMPVSGRGHFEGVIYMENSLTTNAFTEDRVEVIRLLSAQASISMENAKLYEDQSRLIEAQQRFVPIQFLQSLGHSDIARVGLGELVAKEMSVMFADLREFTPLAERLGPRAMIELLNRYFSRMGEPIARAGGFIDSFTGDEIMALFDTSADSAVEAGLGMWRALDDFNLELVAGGASELVLGIGVNTGPLVLGTVGAHDRLKCGVVGDTVNLASRIEQLTKLYRARFLIGEHTYASLSAPERLSVRKVDYVAVKGRTAPASLFEVLDVETPERRRAKEATRGRLAEAMASYVERDFSRARAMFDEVAAADPLDAVATLFGERARRYVTQAPPRDWLGYETLRIK
jgi:predicted ATPase/class 3 adenylate cyclase